MKDLVNLALGLSIILIGLIMVLTFQLLGLMLAETLFPHISFIGQFLVLAVSLVLSVFIVAKCAQASVGAQTDDWQKR